MKDAGRVTISPGVGAVIDTDHFISAGSGACTKSSRPRRYAQGSAAPSDPSRFLTNSLPPGPTHPARALRPVEVAARRDPVGTARL